jgi:hypothetical protein
MSSTELNKWKQQICQALVSPSMTWQWQDYIIPLWLFNLLQHITLARLTSPSPPSCFSHVIPSFLNASPFFHCIFYMPNLDSVVRLSWGIICLRKIFPASLGRFRWSLGFFNTVLLPISLLGLNSLSFQSLPIYLSCPQSKHRLRTGTMSYSSLCFILCLSYIA